MSKGRLYIPDRSKLYYGAVLLAFIGTVALIWCNYYCFGTLNMEFAELSIRIGDRYRAEAWLYVVGVLHLLTDLALPIGYILAKKNLRLAGIFGVGGVLYNAFFIIALLLQVTFTVLGMVFSSDFQIFSTNFFENLLAWVIIGPMVIVALILMIVTIVIAAALFTALKGLPYAVSAVTYSLEHEKVLHSKKLAATINALSLLAIPCIDILICVYPLNSFLPLAIDRLWLLFIPYSIHAVAALMFGLSMKNLPPEAPKEQNSEEKLTEPSPTIAESIIPKLIDR